MFFMSRNFTLKNRNSVSPLNTSVLNLIGIYSVMIFILCVLTNSLLLLVFNRYKKLRTPLNQLIMIMTIFNLICSVQFPFVIHSHFNHKWIWSRSVCIFSGFLVYFVGCIQVYLMVIISYVRFIILKKPKNKKKIKLRFIVKSVLISIMISLFWSTAPIFGWSHYSLEDSFVSCSVEFNEKSLNVISYNISMFIFVFLVPFGIIIYTNTRSLLLVTLFC